MHRKIENSIVKVLDGDAQKSALEFTAYLRANGMLFARGTGYWENKPYWLVKHKNKYICFILIGGNSKSEWTVWFDDSNSNCFANFPLDEYMKKFVWDNIDFCGKCGGSGIQGTHKTIFGKEFANVCRTLMKFTNPNIETTECMKMLAAIRKNDVVKNI